MMDEDQLKQLAGQLSHPEGQLGLDVAEEMHRSNLGMTKSAIGALALHAGDQILEIGHGNAAHLEHLFSLAPELSYTGLEISETMHTAAVVMNADLAKQEMLRFQLYEGVKIPFSDACFSKIFTVNTVYFWQNPGDFAREIARVLHPEGKFALAFAQRSFMEKLPFTRFGFQLYDTADLRGILEKSGMNVEAMEDFEEEVRARSGEKVTRKYTVLQCSAKK